jgi:hypothetical protein
MVSRAPSRSYEPLAVRICKAAHVIMDGKPSQWVSVNRVSEHIKVKDEEMLNGAISHAEQRGWLMVEGQPVHSLLLTDPGKLVAIKKSGYSNAPEKPKAAPGNIRKK